MLSVIGNLVNIGIVIYLGIQAKSCLSPDQVFDLNLNAVQNPLVLSFVAVLALFIARKS